MEKNATPERMILKAERPAPAVITVDVDPEALNCPKCLRPLEPPVLQCTAGHVLCSTCHGDLLDKDINRIAEVIVRHDNAVDAISVMYGRKGKEAWADRWGGEGGKPSRLQQDEYLTSVHGHYGQFKDFVVVRSLTFVSNLRSYGPYGKEDGVPFALHAGPGGKIMGFHARSGQFLDAIGTYVKMDNY